MNTRFLPFIVTLVANLCVFTHAHAQSVCDDLSAEIFKHPTSPNLLVLRLNNQSDEFVNYPSLDLLYEDEVVAAGETTLFQFPEISYHLLEPEMLIVEGESYTFTIDIYAFFGSEYICSFEWTGVPYQPEGCFDGLFRVSALATVEQEVELVVRDEFDNTVITQNLWMAFGNLAPSFPLCLPRACYTVSLEAVGSTFQSNYLLTWETDGQTWFNRLVNASESFSAFELDLWEGCSFVSVSDPSSVDATSPLFPTLVTSGAPLRPITPFANPQHVRIFSVTGVCVANTYGFDFTAPRIPGMYILLIEDALNKSRTQRLVVH